MANAEGSRSGSKSAAVGLVAILVFAVWWRGHTFAPTVEDLLGVAPWPVVEGEAEPLDCDEAAYAYMARRMLQGDRLYAELSENKPPGGYWLFALAVRIGGPNELTIRLMPIPAVLGTIALAWWIGQRLGGIVTALASAILYALLSTDPYIYGNGAQLEQWINLFWTASLAALIAAFDSRRHRGHWLCVAGACLGAGVLVKQVVVTHLAIALIAIVAARGGKGVSGLARDCFDLLGSFTGVLLAAAGYLVLRGVGGDAFEDVILAGRAIATDLPPEPGAPSGWVRWLTGNADPKGALPAPFGSTDYLVWWGLGTWPAWLAALPCLVRLAAIRPSVPRVLVAAWTVSAMIQVVLPGLYWPHYYLLPTPGLALVIALTLADLIKAGWKSRASIVFGAALLGSIVGVAAIQVRDYLLVPAEELTIRYKGGRQWVVLRDLGRTLKERAAGWPDPHLHIWGWQSPLLFYSGLDASSRHFFTNNLLRDFAERPHPVVSPRIDELMADLREAPPDLVLAAYPPFPALRDFLRDGYLPSDLLPMSSDGRGLWVRRDRWADFQGRTGAINPSVRAVDDPGRGGPRHKMIGAPP